MVLARLPCDASHHATKPEDCESGWSALLLRRKTLPVRSTLETRTKISDPTSKLSRRLRNRMADELASSTAVQSSTALGSETLRKSRGCPRLQQLSVYSNRWRPHPSIWARSVSLFVVSAVAGGVVLYAFALVSAAAGGRLARLFGGRGAGRVAARCSPARCSPRPLLLRRCRSCSCPLRGRSFRFRRRPCHCHWTRRA